MLNGKELGRAIGQAIDRKLTSGSVKSKTEIARHFGVKLPSIYDWIKKGSISKDKLPELWSYFSDVVGPEHWGLKELHAPVMGGSSKINSPTSRENDLLKSYKSISHERKEIINYLLLNNDEKTPGWVDSDTRAYITTLEHKVKEWLAKEPNNKPKKRSA